MIQQDGNGRAQMIIDCAVETEWWTNQVQLESIARSAINATMGHLDQSITADSEVSLLFTDDARVQQLNKQWRHIDRPTNVLSFAAQEADALPTPVLGDIVLARETIEREASEQGKFREDHLTHLIIHGFLHLLGFDHETDADAHEMETLETIVLEGLEIADPYAAM